MSRLSKPITQIKPVYDVVVIGSGYGGSIAASRFSRAGFKVGMLEKGKEFQPGEYPDSMVEATKELQLNTDSRAAEHNGLYEFHVSENISVFKGCGLGGTSLVNANVSIKPEPRVFEDARWPEAIRNDMPSMDAAYETARAMLRPSPYPEGKPNYPPLAKAVAMKKSADYMDEEFRLLDINVNFTVDGPNHVGAEAHPCNNCGDCLTGCNYSAKNTLIMNYLPDAVNNGAEIFCNVHVSHVTRSGDDWLVYFTVYNTGRDKFQAPPLFVRAKHVVVSAGSLGSTEIMLRSKANGLDISDSVGDRFTGNGDVLGFAYNCDDEIDGMGWGNLGPKAGLKPVGPCITSIIDMRNKPELNDGMTFEEGSIPSPLVHAINLSLLTLTHTIGVDTDGGFTDWLKEKKEEAISLVRGPYHGATNNTQTYLIMSHDDGKGKMNLKDGKLNIDWPGVGDQPIFEKAAGAMKDATTALGGTFIRNVTWDKMFNKTVVTVHPLGGCCMADNAANGVTDHTGNVFKGNSGNEVHEGLYVLDGAIVPLPLGTNPLFTISAVAERSCKIVLEKMNKSASYDFPAVTSGNGQVKAGVQFTETMRGFFSNTEKDDYQKGFDKGQADSSPFMFTLTIQSQDVDGMVSDQAHEGQIMGSVVAPVLSSQPMMVTDGKFNLFRKDDTDPNLKLMGYRMVLSSVEGKQYYFDGFKRVEHDKGKFDMWSDTSTLYITLYDGPDNTAPVIGRGILHILPTDFSIQMTTMKTLNTTNMMDSLMALKKFGSFFSVQVYESFFSKMFG